MAKVCKYQNCEAAGSPQFMIHERGEAYGKGFCSTTHALLYLVSKLAEPNAREDAILHGEGYAYSSGDLGPGELTATLRSKHLVIITLTGRSVNTTPVPVDLS